MSKDSNMEKVKSASLQKSKSANVQDLDFEGWIGQVPETIRKEGYWRLIAYQKAFYLYELIWADTDAWMRDLRGRELTRQINRQKRG